MVRKHGTHIMRVSKTKKGRKIVFRPVRKGQNQVTIYRYGKGKATKSNTREYIGKKRRK